MRMLDLLCNYRPHQDEGAKPVSAYKTPELLGRQLNDVEARFSPQLLYAEGDLDLLKEGVRVAVVGTRSPSAEGLQRARRVSRILAGEGFIVVSGLAKGIDTTAHETAIAEGGRTVAVLGCSLDRYYPPENRDLQERIRRDHLLVSQFPPSTPPLRKNFPQRNRTMALLSEATVIVEAAERSGTVSQGWEALRLGRPLFLLRSLVEDNGLRWPTEMRRYGALVLADPEDLLLELPPPSSELARAIAF